MSTILRKGGFYLLFAIVIPLLLLEGAFRLLPVASPPYLQPVTAQNPVPRFQPNVDYVYSAGWNFPIRSRKHSNNFGYNHVADYRPHDTTPLLAVIGDSFVEAHEVDTGKSAAELLHARLHGKGRVYSIGISGAPLSQYLAFADYARTIFRPDALAIVVIGNDFDESLLKYKSEPRLHYFADNGELRRVDYEISTAKQILRSSAFVRYAQHNLLLGHRLEQIRQRVTGRQGSDPDLEYQARIPDSRKAVDYFLDQLPARSGLEPRSILLVLDAVRPAIYSEEMLRQAENGYHTQMRRYLDGQARARGFQVIDLQPVFIARHRRDNSRFEFPTDKHWNELGQRVVAEEIEKSDLFSRVFGSRAVTTAATQ
jgi:hypothetical protein